MTRAIAFALLALGPVVSNARVQAGQPGGAQPATQHGRPRVPSASRDSQAVEYAAVVDARYSGAPGDTVNGVPTFSTLTGALLHLNVPSRTGVLHGAGRAVIYVKNGRYREKITVDRPRTTLRGESRDSTIITYDAYAGQPTPEGGRYGTRGSYTLRVVAPDFRAENLTIENAFDYPANARKQDGDTTKVRDAQAVALMLDHGSDRASFVDVRVTGHQDTLFPNAGRSYFYKCEVLGSVDFIFGAGRAVFDDCDIISRDRGSSTNNGYITAASTPIAQRYGFVFLRSRLRKETSAMAPSSVTLGRPWHPFGDPDAIASVVFIDCWMDDHIGAKGWDRMSALDSTGVRIWFEPGSARFAEAGTKGPGALVSPSRRTLSASDLKSYSPRAVLDGWVPPLPGLATGLPGPHANNTYLHPGHRRAHNSPPIVRCSIKHGAVEFFEPIRPF